MKCFRLCMYVCSLSLSHPYLLNAHSSVIPPYTLVWPTSVKTKLGEFHEGSNGRSNPPSSIRFNSIQRMMKKKRRRSPPLDHPMNGNERVLMCAWRHVRPCQQQPPWLRFPDPNKVNPPYLLILLLSPLLPYFLLALLGGSRWVYVFYQLQSRVDVG